MERIIEPNQITNEDQCNESHCSQGSTKSSIHASLPNSNQQSTSRKGNRRRELKTPTPSSSRNAETMAAAQAESSQSARGTSPVEGQKGSSISDSDKDNEEMSSSTKTENRSVRKGKWAVSHQTPFQSTFFDDVNILLFVYF